MRLLILLIIVAVSVYALWFRSEPPPPPPPMKVEDTFISGPLAPYDKAQKFQQQDYNQALDEHRKAMDEQEEQ